MPVCPVPGFENLPIFNSPGRDAEPAIVMDNFKLRNGDATILNQMSFCVPKGSLFAMIGESGAGKTTTLRVLGRRLNERVLTMEGTGIVPTNTWYIPQEQGALYEYDTPLQIISFLHQRMHGSGHAESIKEATKILQEVAVDTEDHNKLVGDTNSGLSVSQRRLVGVAAALCARAEILLLDEITTGLDSTTARHVIGVLRNLTKTMGVTIVCTIHQPSDEVMSLFDDVLVLRRTGAFEAAELTEKDFASGASFADLFLTVESERRTISDSHKALIAKQKVKSLQAQMAFQPRTGSFMNDLVLLTKRTAFRQWNNIFGVRLRTVLSLVLAIMVGFCYFQLPTNDATFLRDWLGFFLIITATSFMAIVISSGFFPAEKLSFENEQLQSHVYSLAAMTLGRFLVEAAIAIVLSAFVFVTMGIAGVEELYGRFWFAVVLQFLVSDSFGFLCSTIFRPEVSIGAVIPCVGFVSMLIGTGMAAVPKKDAGWLFHVCKWGSFFKYAFASIATDQFPLFTATCNPFTDSGCAFPTSQTVLSYLDLYDQSDFLNTYKFQWIILVGIIVLFRTLAFVRLYFIVRGSKLSYSNVTKQVKPTKAQPQSIEPTFAATKPDGATAVEMDEAVDRQMSQSFCTVPANKDVVLHWEKLKISVHEGGKSKTILREVTGEAHAGSVTALVGRAKVGKTLFLSVVSQIVPINAMDWSGSSGRVYMKFKDDGTTVYDYTVGFAYQIDAFVPNDNVSEAVLRNMKCPNENEKKWLLKNMGIAHIEHKAVTDISGGQLRRLSIACQLARKPQVLLLDEPTSGLDAAVAFDIMTELRDFARKTHTIIICTLQQPGKMLMPLVDSFMFMHCGTVAFQGTIEEAIAHYNVTDEDCKTMSPTDVIVDRVSGLDCRDPTWVHDQSDGASCKTCVQPRTLPTLGTMFGMSGFGNLLRRTYLSRASKPLGFLIETVGKFIALPLWLSIMFAQVDDPTGINRLGLLMVMTCAFGFVALILPPVLFSLERTTYEREIAAGDYSPVTYIVSKWVFEFPMELIGIAAGCGLTYGIVGLTGNFAVYMFSTFLVYNACMGIGFMLSVLPMPLNATCGLSAFVIVAFMLGCGVLVTPTQIARVGFMYMLEIISPAKPGFLLQIRYELNEGLLKLFGFDRVIDEEGFCWGLLLGTLVLYRLGGIVAALILQALAVRKTPNFGRKK